MYHPGPDIDIVIGVEIVILTSCVSNDFIELQLVAKETADSTETLDELERFTALVSDEFNLDTEALVVHEKPISEALLTLDFKGDAGLGILEMFWVLLLRLVQILDPYIFRAW